MGNEHYARALLDEELNKLADSWSQYHITARYHNTVAEKDGIVRAGYIRTGLEIGKGQSGVVEIIKKHTYQWMFYALKTITRKDIADNGEDAVKIVVNEIDILFRVRQSACPSVIHFEDFTSDEKNVYLIFEHAYGGNFDDVLASVSHYNENTRNTKHKAFDEDEAGLYLIQLAEGLSCLEKHRIEHRDLKPDNLLLDKDGNLKIADFGLAKHHSLINTQTPESFPANAYAPPEIIYKALNNDRTPLTSKWHRYDWWAFGVLMYEFVMGFRPFNEDTLQELYDSIIKHQLTFPTTHPSNEYQKLVAALLKVNVRYGYPERGGENRWKILIQQITEITQNVGNGQGKNTGSANTQQLATEHLQGKKGPYILKARSHKSQYSRLNGPNTKTECKFPIPDCMCIITQHLVFSTALLLCLSLLPSIKKAFIWCSKEKSKVVCVCILQLSCMDNQSPPIRVLRRDRGPAQNLLASNQNEANKPTTLQDREAVYQKARERIFGEPAPSLGTDEPEISDAEAKQASVQRLKQAIINALADDSEVHENNKKEDDDKKDSRE
ncbi:protein kinase domain-containing protein [Ditylenchus destructor]|nr:protein kinase domain-containing protein [Ditylenchus destructor]